MPTRFQNRPTLIATALATTLLLSACQSSNDAPPSASSTTPTPATVIAGQYPLNTPLGTPVTFSKNGVASTQPPFQMTAGYGSAAFHNPSAQADVFYTASDRGPNIKCGDSAKAPVGIADFCGSTDATGSFVVDNSGKIFPAPFFDPSIYKFQMRQQGGSMAPVVIQTITLKDKDGNPIGGLSNDLPDRPKDLTKVATTDASVANTENGYSNDGHRLPFNQNSLDTEGLAQLADGSFWVGEEYAPSILHVAADGRVLERVVPNDSGVMNPITGKSMSVCDALKKGTTATPAANYPINCSLPGILDLRSLNRGIEDLAVSPDGKTLYFGMQSPLANPSKDAYKISRNNRVFTASLNADGSFGQVTGEYVYVLDLPDTFLADNPGNASSNPTVTKAAKQNAVKLSDMSVTANGHLIQLERISYTTKLYHSDLTAATNILGSKWDDRATQPSLTQQTDLTAAGITPVKKTLVFDTVTDYPTAQAKIEGIAFLNSDFMMMINDNDFGIGGDPTQIDLLKATAQVAQ